MHHYLKDESLDLKEIHFSSGKITCAIILSILQNLPAFLNTDSPTDSTAVIFFYFLFRTDSADTIIDFIIKAAAIQVFSSAMVA